MLPTSLWISSSVLRGIFIPISPALTIITILLIRVENCENDFTGQFVGISDGDTITLLHDGRGEKIRLYGIDAPEKGQAFGNKAKQFVSLLVFGEEVKVEAKGQDRYGRKVADVILSDGRNLSREIVKAGFAWWFRKYAPKDKELQALESEAREAKRGLWTDREPVPPWNYRALIRERQAR